MGSPMLITSEYVTSSTPPHPLQGGVVTIEVEGVNNKQLKKRKQ